MSTVEDALQAIGAATTQVDLNAVYAAHMTRLTLNDEPRENLRTLAQAWQDRSLDLAADIRKALTSDHLVGVEHAADSKKYICRHGMYRTEHWCDDHADNIAEAGEQA